MTSGTAIGGSGRPYVRAETIEGDVWQVVLDRPERRNALGQAVADAFRQSVDDALSRGCKAISLIGEGNAFCSGADLGEGRRGSVEEVLTTVADSPVPWVACVKGPAVGAGSALVAVCAFSIVSDDAWFALPEVSALGRFPVGMANWIAPVTGMRSLLRVGLSGRRISPAEAHAMGWITEHVTAQRFAEECSDLVRWLAGLDAAVLAQAQDRWRAQLRGGRELLGASSSSSSSS